MLDRGGRSVAPWLLGPVGHVRYDAGAIEELEAGDEADALSCKRVGGLVIRSFGRSSCE